MCALRWGSARADPGNRAEDGGTPGRAGADHARRRRCRTRARARRALRPESRGELGRRARFEHDGVVGAARKVVSESRERTFDDDVRRCRSTARSADDEWPASCARASPPTERQRAHDRDQDPPRRLHHRHTRAHDLRARRATSGRSRPWRCACSTKYSPSRPVRLLGVRVAGLSTCVPTAATGSEGPDAEEEQHSIAGSEHAVGVVDSHRSSGHQLSLQV